ncbi:AMP-dependent synthetase/ligase [Microlunatus panaciterrae]|uniref:Acyl-CoA synthetase n=1 Tax=Microlunatus panaciterrae TaxID=400768 RepID=A0ABS2RLK4_9ACTN|nr:long-chain fatty acid--CoA ligase [Microlunatus panaciterrae]MBM7799881.1 long-chain acyl-CoA synthetase [Microlunatus panaciterrae]
MTETLEERLALRPPSVGAMLLEQVRASGPREAFRYLDGKNWVSLSWDQTKDRVFELAAGLMALGLQHEDRVAIASNTRIEWILADLAVMCAGGATTTVYPTTQHEDVAYILGDSQSKIVIAEDDLQVAKVLDHLHQLPELITIVLLDGKVDHEKVTSWEQLTIAGRAYLAEHPTSVDDAIAKVGPDSLSTLIYTSGTTGRPKGVELVHDSWTYEGAAIEEMKDLLSKEDLQYLWLPLSHVFGKALIAVQLKIGFATAVDGVIERIVDNLGQVHPTFMAGAPRIFEKVRAKVMMGASSGVKGKIFDWAFSIGRKTSAIRLEGRYPTGLLGVQYKMADRLVFSKIKERMGGNIRFFISGSAALSREVQEWFFAADLRVLEGYGLTETSAASFVNDPRTPRFGTVGPPVPGTQVKIAPDGEILIKGPGVMRGYHNHPQATAEVLADGWLATGDIGELDAEGYLRITDRKKDLIKTSGGKYVAPQKVEGVVKAASPYISQIIVHGEGRKYVSALIALDPEAINEWAAAHGQAGKSYEELAQSGEVRTMIETFINEANKNLERWETIKKFEILPNELSVEDGEVTPSLKIRRKAVEKKYEDMLNSLYED